MFEEISEQAYTACSELIERAGLKEGQILVVGCSSSEVCGDRIGSNSNMDTMFSPGDNGINGFFDELDGNRSIGITLIRPMFVNNATL